MMKKILETLNRKWAEYLLEMIVITLGVVGAFALNNWNENRIKQTELNTYLLNLVENLKSDVTSMTSLEDAHIFRFYSLQHLLKLSGESPYEEQGDNLNVSPFKKTFIWEAPIPTLYDEEFIRLTYLWSHRLMNQNVNQVAINELKSTGMFSQLNNISLKTAINDYYSEWEWKTGETNQETHRDIVENWETSLGEEGVLTSNVMSLEDPLDLLRNNRNRVYLVKRLIREAGWVMYRARETRKNANALILQIENELMH